MTGLLLVAALAVTSADRLALADKLYNRGDYAEARREYEALASAKDLAADELLYRRAECTQALDGDAKALPLYADLLTRFPNSRHAARARYHRALATAGEARRADLRALDTDRVEKSLRAAALYHLGEELQDASYFERAVSCDPKGPFAAYAKLRRAALLAKRPEAAERRMAVSLLLDVAFDEKGPIAEEALYLATATSFAEKRYGEALSLAQRYLKKHPSGAHAGAVNDLAAWSAYMSGKMSEALSYALSARTDDTSYVRAAAIQATDTPAAAAAAYRDYLEAYPQGRYRAQADLALSRLEFDAASSDRNVALSIETARRSAELSQAPADRLRLGWAYEQAGDTNAALRTYVELATRHPATAEAADALFRKAMIDLRAERWAAGELALKEALAGKLDPTRRATAQYWRGMAAIRLGHYVEGSASLRAALESGLTLDESREARLVLADIDFSEGRTGEAVAAYGRLVREGAVERMSAAKALAVGRLLAGEEARICATALVRASDPAWRQAGYALLGDIEEATNNFMAASAAYRQAFEEDAATESLREISVKLGDYALKDGDLRLASSAYRRAIDLNPRAADVRARAYWGLAQIARAENDPASARGYATVVVTLFEKSPQAADAARLLKEVPAP